MDTIALHTFGEAIEAVKQGKKAKRVNWNGKDQYIELAIRVSFITPKNHVVNVDHISMGNSAIAFYGTQGIQVGWLASQADILSEDWIIFE